MLTHSVGKVIAVSATVASLLFRKSASVYPSGTRPCAYLHTCARGRRDRSDCRSIGLSGTGGQ